MKSPVRIVAWLMGLMAVSLLMACQSVRTTAPGMVGVEREPRKRSLVGRSPPVPPTRLESATEGCICKSREYESLCFDCIPIDLVAP